ncbi:DUF3311 domain-containing protein [Natronorubrum sulfidifaciens]|uniref:DUF3311 domain-containing protein n=1 Tax=Natronorubrum sulfidifaciens JCM 14089 TaxID=1230460 RepID=L9W786_9EURY|nr:DUF3311 domain-containing protein [Natronorubrum sulfidifaciens]ELY45202.1 hypothetical protein C495_09675 [Natronorubrum sulfidifaciens JCM 14089]
MRRLELGGWAVIALVLCGLAIPWFLWGSATVVAGLPLWLWWHIGWMGLASIVFWLFTKRAWGIGIETDATDSSEDHRSTPPSRSANGGEQP